MASTNSTATGIVLQDTTGASAANLSVANGDGTNTATTLKIEKSVAKSSIDSGSLGLQFVHENSDLSRLNQGRGVSLGSIKIVDSLGVEKTLNFLTSAPKTLGDVITKINDSGLAVTAKLNETGDGLVLVDTGSGQRDAWCHRSRWWCICQRSRNCGDRQVDLRRRVTRSGIAASQNIQLVLTGSEQAIGRCFQDPICQRTGWGKHSTIRPQ